MVFFAASRMWRRATIIDLLRVGRSDIYVIKDIEIVSPEDVSVLNSTGVASLTLVTCFPFYFVGSAPQRFIVHAFIAGSDQAHQKFGMSRSTVEKINTQEGKR